MEQTGDGITISVKTLDKTWRKNGCDIVKLTIKLPHLEYGAVRTAGNLFSQNNRDKSNPAVQRINTYYQGMARMLTRYAEKTLFTSALRKHPAQTASYRRPDGWEPYRLTAQFIVTLHNTEHLSLYTDIDEFADGLTVRERVADTWTLEDGLPVGLDAFFPTEGLSLPGAVRRQVMQAAFRQMKAIAPDEETRFPTLKRTFRTEDFFLLPDKLVLFWQSGVACPVSQGVREIAIPYKTEKMPRPGVDKRTAP